MNLSLFLMSMFLTISLEAAAAFISAKARLSFRVVMSKPRALSKLSFRSRLLLRDISVFCLMSLDMWDTEDIRDADDVFYTFGQGARGHTAVPDDCQYTTETLTVFCASHSLTTITCRGRESRVLRYTGPHWHRGVRGSHSLYDNISRAAHFYAELGNSIEGLWQITKEPFPVLIALDGRKSHFRLNPSFRHFSFRLIKT